MNDGAPPLGEILVGCLMLFGPMIIVSLLAIGIAAVLCTVSDWRKRKGGKR